MEAAPNIVVKLWDNVSHEEAFKIVKEKIAWASCVDGMMAIHPSISFEEALVLVVYYEDPNPKPVKEHEMIAITQQAMREFIRLEIKKLCMVHNTLDFDELFVLAKYKYLKK